MPDTTDVPALERRLFCFGLGYSARRLVAHLEGGGWRVSGTVREAPADPHASGSSVTLYSFDGTRPSAEAAAELKAATHILISVPPDADGDPVLRHHYNDLAGATQVRWIGYLSTVGVYGDHDGNWVDETTPVAPVSRRSQQRVTAENAWLDFARETGRRVVLFRLAGIYGPGRSAVDSVRTGRARRIIKPGQRFNRIHVEDIARIVEASMSGRGSARVLNVTDDEPAPPQDVIGYAASLVGAPMPPDVAFHSADLSPMAKSFYGENKQVRNDLVKQDLGITLAYPTYREGLADIARNR